MSVTTLAQVPSITLEPKPPILRLIITGTPIERSTGTGTASSSQVQPAASWTSSRDFDPGLASSESVIDEKAPVAALSAVVQWLHRESGLTWDQIARLFGVSRRTVHLWANGGSMNSRHFSILSEVTKIVRGLPVATPQARRELLLVPGQDRSLYDVVRERLASDYVEANFDSINAAVRQALTELDGSTKSAVTMITGLSSEEIDDLGGLD